MKKNFIKNQSGFTLIELLIVIAIIGVLIGIIAVALNNARIRSRDAKRAGDMRQMITALEQYYIQNGTYPTGTGSVSVDGVMLSDPLAMDSALEPFIPNYTPIMPIAPSPADENCSADQIRGGNSYWYDAAIDGLTYTLTFCLGKESGSWQAGIRVATPSGVQ